LRFHSNLCTSETWSFFSCNVTACLVLASCRRPLSHFLLKNSFYVHFFCSSMRITLVVTIVLPYVWVSFTFSASFTFQETSIIVLHYYSVCSFEKEISDKNRLCKNMLRVNFHVFKNNFIKIKNTLQKQLLLFSQIYS